MSDTYLELVNKVLKPFNEVQLTASNFATIEDGFHQHAKDAINDAIYDIYLYEDTQWPFLWRTGIIPTLTDGSIEYTPDSSATLLKWNSFRLVRDDVKGVDSYPLNELDYDLYNKVYRARDMNMDSNDYGIPQRISRTPQNNIVISPPSNVSYDVEYEYFAIPDTLQAYNDTTVIPRPFSQIITDRALVYLHMFRGDAEISQLINQRYERRISDMRRILIRRSNTMVPIQ